MRRLITLTRVLALLLLFSLSFSLLSCSGGNIEYCELGISLPEDFKKTDGGETYDLAYSNGVIFVGILRISHDAAAEVSMPTTMTPLKLAELHLLENGMAGENSEIREEGDVPYYTYKSGEGMADYFYMPTFYCTPFAYFIITFITPAPVGDASIPEILSYVSTVYLIP